MKKLLGVLVAGWVLSAASAAWAQIAVLDLRYVFDNHQRYKQQVEQLRQRVQAAEAELNKQREHLRKLVRERDKYKVDSAQYKQLDAEIARMRANVEAQFRLQQKDFLREEARIQLQIYNEIQAEVRAFAQRHRLTLVIQFSGKQPKDATPREVVRYVNRLVVYHHPGIDITQQIVQALNARVARNPNQPIRPGVPLPPRR